ncbi:phosphopantothenoylcysteine decarboxylase subunit VHS3 [Rosa sericea]
MVALCSSERNSFWVGSVLEAMVVNTVLSAHNSLALLLLATGSLMNDINVSPKLAAVTGSFPFEELFKLEKPGPENKDASDTEDDEEDDDDDDVPEEEDDAGDEDFSGEEGEDADPEDEPEANGDGGSDDDDDKDEDDDDGDDDEDEDAEDEEEEEEEEEVPQPPAKKRK